MLEFRKNRNGDTYPITPKKIRDYSDNDGVEINISIDDADDLEEFAKSKIEMDGESFTDKLYEVSEELKNETLRYGSSLIETSGMDKQGIQYIMPIIENIGDNLELELVNEDWQWNYKQNGEKGYMMELNSIKKRTLEQALYELDKEFGYYENQSRPKNKGEEVAQKIWEVIAIQPKDEELGRYKNRERDYARGKQIIKDTIDYAFNTAMRKLPR